MDFWGTIRVLLRRWYVTLPAFVMSLGITGVAYSMVPLQYQSVSVLVLTTPLSGGTKTPQADTPNSLTNPLLNFDQSLALAGSIVIQQMNSSETAQALGVTPGAATTYQVSNGSTNPELLESGPFLFVQGTASSAAAAQRITRQASAMAAVVLAQRQTELKAPASTHITMHVVVPATAGQPLKGSPERMAAAALVLAGLVSLVAVFGFESLASHRRRKRRFPQDRGPERASPREEGHQDDPRARQGTGVPAPPPGPRDEPVMVRGIARIPWRGRRPRSPGVPGPSRVFVAEEP